MLRSLFSLPVARALHGQRTSCPIRIKQLISKGLEQGYLTYAEVNDHLPDDMVDPEQIEDIIGMINGMGIDVHEVAPDVEPCFSTMATPATAKSMTPRLKKLPPR